MSLKKIGVLVGTIAVAAVAAVPVVKAQTAKSDLVAAITKIENDGIKADLASDKSWTEKYLADDWTGCDSSGKWFTKAEQLKMFADPKNNKYTSEKIGELKVRVYGSTAVATYRDTYDAMILGEHRARTILTTDVFVKMGADWKQVSSHSTQTK
jgi:Tfp pilus assembly major pilin PilA